MLVEFTLTDNFMENVLVSPSDYQPAYGGTSVGLDLYCASKTTIVVPPLFRKPYEGEDTFFDIRNYKVLIPTGVKIRLPPNTQGLILERGSITKTPLKVRAGVIDPGYTAEIFINCINLSDVQVNIKPGEKTPFQLVCTPTLAMRLTSENDYQAKTKDSIRGEACLGSTG